MPKYKGKRKYKRRRKRRNVNGLIKLIKKVDRRQEFKMTPSLWIEKNHGQISMTEIDTAYAGFQAIFQDIPQQLGTAFAPGQNQRLGYDLYPQVYIVDMVLARKNLDTNLQRFRVSIIRYKGEMDFNIDNSINNGWQLLNNQGTHFCKPGEVWSSKPYIRNQVEVLYDRTYTINKDTIKDLNVKFRCQIKRKMTFETTGSGPASVGAGNVFIVVSSDKNWNMLRYHTYGFYKDLQ